MNDPFSPTSLRDYALIADGERGALIGPHGDVAWMCAPHWDSDAVFSTLIGGAGAYAVTPVDRFVWGGYYEDGALIWRSRWVTADGMIECREALAFPGDAHRTVLLRRIIARDGDAHVHAIFEPAAGFGSQHARRLSKDEHGVWSAQAGSLRFRWSGAGHAKHVSGTAAQQLSLDLRVPHGKHHDLVLEISDKPLGDPVDPDDAWRSTERAWADQVPALENTLVASDARRSYAVLRGLTTSGGGTVASATTSLPERAEEGRNYDYRYVWIRDQCFIGQAIAAADPADPMLDDAVRFVSERLLDDGPQLAPAYTARGGRVPDQRRLDLPGYPGGYDIVGNWVNKQFQLDAFGESLLLLAAAAKHDRLDTDGWRAAQVAADAIAKRWQEPDAGIWELEDQAWTHSRLTCAAGLRSIAALPSSAEAVHAVNWTSLADQIVADTAKKALHPSGRWQRTPQDPRLDGALLLPPLRGALPVNDPRTRQTLDSYVEDLTQDHFAYRFRHDDRALDQAEGAFVLCGFITALAQLQQGRKVEAVRWFERNRTACSATGLFSEEYDVRQRQLRGNLPQAFVHSMMIECAVRIAEQTDGLVED